MQWLNRDCPGQLAYAVLHRDEARPHIHAAVIPADSQGHLSYKEYFNGREKLRALQKTYAEALEPLGIESNSTLVKAVRRTQYTKGIDGWRVPGMVHELQEQERALEADLQARAAHDRPLGEMPTVKAGDLGNAQRYRRRVEAEVLRTVRAREAMSLTMRRQEEKKGCQAREHVRLLKHEVERKEAALTRYRAAVEQVITPAQKERVVELTKGHKRVLDKGKDLDR